MPSVKAKIEITDDMTAEDVADALEDLQQWLNRAIDIAPTFVQPKTATMTRSLIAARKRLAELRESLRHSGF